MSWLAGTVIVAVAAAGAVELDGLRHATERGDVDEIARVGVLAGPAVVERALEADDRMAQLGGIVAAPAVAQREQLLPALAEVARGGDQRTALPAAWAARAIAPRSRQEDRPDDVAAEDVADWRAMWLALAMRGDRWIEVRTAALATAAELARVGGGGSSDVDVGFELAAVLADPDPALRAAALALVPQPAPTALRATIAAAVANEAGPRVALVAAQALCADLVADDPAPVLAALGDAGLARIRALVTTIPDDARADIGAIRDVARCLAAGASPDSATALRALFAHADPQLLAALRPLKLEK